MNCHQYLVKTDGSLHNVSVLVCTHFSLQLGKVYIIVIALVSHLSAKAKCRSLRAETQPRVLQIGVAGFE